MTTLLACLRSARLLLAGLLLAVAVGCDANSVMPDRADATEFASIAPVQVETALIRRGSIVQRITAPSSIVARREAHIGTEVTGRIEEILVREGDRVERGDPLFKIDPKPYELALHRAEAVLERVHAELEQMRSDLARGRKLQQRAVVSDMETDRIATGVAVAQAQEREATEAVALAKRNLDQTLVRAPFSGSVTRRLVDEGTTALVQPQTIVIVLQETQELEAIATIAEIHFAAIAIGDVALLHVDGLPLPIQTEVSAVSDSIDPRTRTFRVKMPVSDNGHRLKAGLFARAEIIPRAKSEILLAPRDALRHQDGLTQVLVVRGGVASLAPVEIGLISENAVEVLGGLREDDEVVVGRAARSLGPGMPVTVIRSRSEEG